MEGGKGGGRSLSCKLAKPTAYEASTKKRPYLYLLMEATLCCGGEVDGGTVMLADRSFPRGKREQAKA